LENNFDGLKYHQVLRGHNKVADELAKHRSSWGATPPGVFMQDLHEPSISKALFNFNKASKSVDDTMTRADDNADSSKDMVIDFDRHPPFMIYPK
jgi:hypothetical protein